MGINFTSICVPFFKKKIYIYICSDAYQFALEMTVAHGGEAILCVTDRCSIERVMTEHQTGENEAMHLKKTKQLTKKIQEHRVQENTTTKKMPPEYVNVSSGMIRNH